MKASLKSFTYRDTTRDERYRKPGGQTPLQKKETQLHCQYQAQVKISQLILSGVKDHSLIKELIKK